MKNAKWWLVQLFAIILYRKSKYTISVSKSMLRLASPPRERPAIYSLPSFNKERKNRIE